MSAQTRRYRAYARECLELAEKVDPPEFRDALLELSRAWIEAAWEKEEDPLSSSDTPVLAEQLSLLWL